MVESYREFSKLFLELYSLKRSIGHQESIKGSSSHVNVLYVLKTCTGMKYRRYFTLISDHLKHCSTALYNDHYDVNGHVPRLQYYSGTMNFQSFVWISGMCYIIIIQSYKYTGMLFNGC